MSSEAAERAAKRITDIKTVLALDIAQRRTVLLWLAQHHPDVFGEALSRALLAVDERDDE